MTKLILSIAFAAALGVPSIAGAQTTPDLATIACRPADSSETPAATISGTPVVCRSIDLGRIRTAMMDVMNDGLNADQKAKLTFAMQVFQSELELHPRYPGFDGNPNN